MNISMGNIFQNKMFTGSMLKSTQEKMERQQKCEGKVAFYENQISGLKDMKCDSLDEISRKLEMLHSYQDSIVAAKQEYNHQQMMHVMDEAIERGEKIAEAAEERKAKTAEERREEMRKEALGIEEEDKGLLTESMEELVELTEELTEEFSEKLTENLLETDEGMFEAYEELPETRDEFSKAGRETFEASEDPLEMVDELSVTGEKTFKANEESLETGEMLEMNEKSLQTAELPATYKPIDYYA